jgi:hypothetical protein
MKFNLKADWAQSIPVLPNKVSPDKELHPAFSQPHPLLEYTGLFANVFNVKMPKNHLKYGQFL